MDKYSAYKIIHFPEKLQAFRERKVTAPPYIRIKPTARCQHACAFCAYSDGTKRPKDRADKHMQTGMHDTMNERDMIPGPKMLDTLDDIARIGVKAVTYSGGGEPLIHPAIVEIMTRTVELGIDLSIITNGQALRGERANVLSKAKWVRISMDYTTAEQMVESRNVPVHFFKEVLVNIAAFASIKQPDCDLEVNYIVRRENCENLVPFAAQLKSLGVQNIRFSPVWVPGFMEYHQPIQAKVEAQLQEAQSLVDETFTLNSTYRLDDPAHASVRSYCRCYVQELVPVIGADLGVYRCHNVSFTNHGLIGYIKDRSFSDLWFSEEAARNIAAFDAHVCKHQCSSDAKNRLIHQLTEAPKDNFV